MFAKDTTEIVHISVDHLQGTAAVLLLQSLGAGAGHTRVVEVDWVETLPGVASWFAQPDLILVFCPHLA